MSFFRDLRVAFYTLRRTQGFSIAVILTLALGIGANFYQPFSDRRGANS
jgi:hypothetical protein